MFSTCTFLPDSRFVFEPEIDKWLQVQRMKSDGSRQRIRLLHLHCGRGAEIENLIRRD